MIKHVCFGMDTYLVDIHWKKAFEGSKTKDHPEGRITWETFKAYYEDAGFLIKGTAEIRTLVYMN